MGCCTDVLGIGVNGLVVVVDGLGNTHGVCVLVKNVFENEYEFTAVLVVLGSVWTDVNGG